MYLVDDTAVERIALSLIDRTLPKGEWTHAGHFAAALWLLRHRPELTQPDDFRGLISRYNEATGTRNTDTSGYHHTITLASMRAATAHLTGYTDTTPIAAMVPALMASRLGKPDWLLAHWSREILFGVPARRGWIDPDLTPLPF